MPRTVSAADVAKARFLRRRAQVDTGVADFQTDVTNLDGTASVPVAPSTPADAAVPGPVAAPAIPATIDVTQPTDVPVAPVNEVVLPPAGAPAIDMAPVNPPVFPAVVAPDAPAFGNVEPEPSVTAQPGATPVAPEAADAPLAADLNPTVANPPVTPEVTTEDVLPDDQKTVTAARVALVAGMRLASARVTAGLEGPDTDVVALADKLSRTHTIGELKIAADTIGETLSVRGTRGLVPQRRTASSVPSARTASGDVPTEAIFMT